MIKFDDLTDIGKGIAIVLKKCRQEIDKKCTPLNWANQRSFIGGLKTIEDHCQELLNVGLFIDGKYVDIDISTIPNSMPTESE